MPELRWILILLGLLLIAGVYVFGRRGSRPPRRRFEPRFTEPPDDGESVRRAPIPVLSAEEWVADGIPEEQEDAPAAASPDPAEETVNQGKAMLDDATESGSRKIIALRVAARSNTRFRGPDVVRLLREEGLEFGQYQIFHRRNEASTDPVFSVASMVEPGTFNMDAMENEQIPGITLFMVLPGPCPGISALDDMIGAAQRIAEDLNGEVLDQTGSTLSRQRAGNLRDEIIAFEHHLALQKRQMAAGKERRRFL